MKGKLEIGEQRLVEIPANVISFFKCPDCGHSPLVDKKEYLECSSCKKKWEVRGGIYDFREAI